jgi:hypothetical protein
MYYIGYILGVILIIWLISKVFSALFGKKDAGTVSGPAVPPSVTEGTESGPDEEEIMPEAEDTFEDSVRHDTDKHPESVVRDTLSDSKKDRTSKKTDSKKEGEMFIKPPSDIDLPETSSVVKGPGVSAEKGSVEKYGPGKSKPSEPGIRSGGEESEDAGEKKTVILYREDTGKYRKRCPFCNTYLTSGNTFCEVCGSKVSA